MANYWIGPSGADGNAGTLVSPWATFAHASSLVAAGDTVNVLPGTYNETLDLNRGGTIGSPVTYKSIVLWGALVINGSAVNSAVGLNAPYLIFDGFDVSGSLYNIGVFFQATAGGSILRHCKIHNIAKGAFGTGDAIGAPAVFSGTITVDSNWIFDIGTAGHGNNIHGMYLQSNLGAYGTGKITNNIIYSIPSGSGIQLWVDPQGWDILHNTIFNTAYNGVVAGATSGTIANNRILNNIFYGCANRPAATVVGGGTFGTGNLVQYNLDYLCTLGYSLDASFTLSNNIASTNPLLVNYQSDGSGDYHLQGSSPAIDAGTSLVPVAVDFDGSARPQGAGYDIGAYEFGNYTHKFTMLSAHV